MGKNLLLYLYTTDKYLYFWDTKEYVEASIRDYPLVVISAQISGNTDGRGDTQKCQKNGRKTYTM